MDDQAIKKLYAALDAAADPKERQAVLIAANSEEARKARERIPSPVKNTAVAQAAPQISRAAQVAEVYLGPINASRKRAGLPPLTAVEAAGEFADLDRAPPLNNGKSLARANLRGSRSDPMTQGAADSMWASIASKMNASLPACLPVPSSAPTAPARLARQSQADVDGVWADIARRGNAERGLKTPTRNHG